MLVATLCGGDKTSRAGNRPSRVAARRRLHDRLDIRCDRSSGGGGAMVERTRSTVRDLRRDNRSVLLWSLFFDQTCIRVEMFDLTMTVRAKAEHRLDPSEHGVYEMVDGISACLARVLADSGVEPSAILGAGVGVPGVVEQGHEVLVHAQTYGWDAVPLERLLRP